MSAGVGTSSTHELVRISCIRAIVELSGPARVVARERFMLRRHRNCFMRNRIQRSIGGGRDGEALHGLWPVTERVHLLPGQHQTNGAFQCQRTKRRQHDLELRAKTGPKRTADIGRFTQTSSDFMPNTVHK